MKAYLISGLLVAALFMAGLSLADQPTPTTCPVMEGNPIDPSLFVDHEGQRIYFFCKMCVSLFQEAPEKYLSWWNGAFHFSTPTYYEEFAKYPALNIFFNDEEVNYLFGLMKNKVVDAIVDEVLRKEDQIKKERPELTEKLDKIKQITLQTTFKEEQKA